MEYLATIGSPLNDRYPIRTENIKTRSFLIYRFHIGKLFLFEISSTDQNSGREIIENSLIFKTPLLVILPIADCGL